MSKNAEPSYGSPTAIDQRRLQAVAAELALQPTLLVILGAGASRDAGVPTFRDADGLYRQPSIRGLKPQDLASLQGYQRNPEKVWQWYRERREEIASCEPHPGQRALALLQAHYEDRVLLVTTNEDDLLERAGCQRVLHVHGDIFETQCAEKCGWRTRDVADNAASFAACPKCGAAVRPGSVWFGEALSPAVLTALKNFDAAACLVVGSSGTVQPISGMPHELAKAGAPVVEVNPYATPLTEHVTHLPWTAAAVLPPLVDLLTSATVRATTRQRRWTRVNTESGTDGDGVNPA